MGKITFWGNTTSVECSTGHLKHKYRYVKHRIGRDRRNVWVKIPNTDNMRKTIDARKLLHMNFVFNTCERRNRLPQFREWTERVKRFSENSTSGQKYMSKTRKQKVFCKLRKKPVSRIKEPASGDSKNEYEGKYKNDEEWQRRHFPTHMRKDFVSTEVCEVIVASRLAAIDSASVGITHNLNIMLVESIREAAYCHDWTHVSKFAEGLSKDLRKNSKCWIFWNTGFLALANIFRYDISRILDFSSLMRRLMANYPPRLTVEVATWLTQKGYFANIVFLLEEDYELLSRPGYEWRVARYDNPKRYAVDFMEELFSTVYQYSCYKRDVLHAVIREDEDEQEALRRSAEFILSLFEGLLDRCALVENDATIFIEPYIELLTCLRSELEAEKMFQKICLNNFGNGILNELYLNFLLEHFPSATQEINDQQRKVSRFNFDLRMDKKLRRAQILRRFVKRKLSRDRGNNLNQIPKPTFSL